MKFAIITSDRNAASVTIRQQLLKRYGFEDDRGIYRLVHNGKIISMHSLDRELLFLENIDREIDADIFIFASTHRSKAGVDAFTVHSIGNWGKAELGGIGRMLCASPSGLLKSAFLHLKENSLGIEAVQEATHHGPYLGKPGMFIEIGSSEAMYLNVDAGAVVADAIIRSINDCGKQDVKSAVGLGGTHYCGNFAKIMLNSDFSVAHVCPKHNLADFDIEMLMQAVDKCIPRAETAIVDWKGLGERKESVKKLLADSGIRFFKTSDF
ncbi:hypothetical protein HYY72_01120 [Candidatus Woesearchaeota archaeon]|nr:hypothetical protein [Candidatus Woesearchaeota archaeon]